MKHLLFICGKNRHRSPTAENIFSELEKVETRSAGINKDSEYRVNDEDIEWADFIFVMEKKHNEKLQTHFKQSLKGKKIIVLNIPDIYKYMEPSLVDALKREVSVYLR